MRSGATDNDFVWALSRCRTDEEMVKLYGAEEIQTICGKSGTGFIEDSFCFHKAQEPTARDRLVFQLRYALSDYGTGSDATHRDWLQADRSPVRSSVAVSRPAADPIDQLDLAAAS
jgi:hypothetical protein